MKVNSLGNLVSHSNLAFFIQFNFFDISLLQISCKIFLAYDFPLHRFLFFLSLENYDYYYYILLTLILDDVHVRIVYFEGRRPLCKALHEKRCSPDIPVYYYATSDNLLRLEEISYFLLFVHIFYCRKFGKFSKVLRLKLFFNSITSDSLSKVFNKAV